MIVWILVLLVLAAGLGYWLIILAEGSYFGSWAVRLIYRFGAARYDTLRIAAVHNDQQVLLPIFQEHLQQITEPEVLDVATGTGRVPLLLATAPWFRGRIVGLDLTPEMLAQARLRQAALAPDAPIIWQLGEAGSLPWSASAFDLVSCLEALEYFPQPRQALAEMARILRPGGTLLISKVPDRWARLLPGRAFTWTAMQHALYELGFEECTLMPWQAGHYELVLARRTRVVSFGSFYV